MYDYIDTVVERSTDRVNFALLMIHLVHTNRGSLDPFGFDRDVLVVFRVITIVLFYICYVRNVSLYFLSIELSDIN